MSEVAKRIAANNIELPNPAAPAANYVPYVYEGNTIYISGQLPMVDGSCEHAIGKVGADYTVEQAQEFARQCGLNIIAQVHAATSGNLDNVRCAKLTVFVNGVPDFSAQPVVANGVSDLMVEVFGDNGKHSRAAVGAGSLPRGVAVEIDAVFIVK